MKRAIGLLVLVAACSNSAEKAAVDPGEALRAAESEVNQRFMQYPDAIKSGSLDSIMAFWSREVVLLEPKIRLDGDSALRKLGADFLRDFTVTRLAFAPSETVAYDSGSVAYQFGYYTEDFAPIQGGDTTNVRNNYAARWVREDGSWRIQRFMAVPAPAKPAAAPAVAAVAPAAGPAGTAQTVAERLDAYARAWVSGDAGAVSAFWADDVKLVEPELELNDKAAAQRMATDFLAGNKLAQLGFTVEDTFLHEGGSVAYQFGHYTKRLQSAGASAHHFLARWKQNAAGAWVLDRFYATPK